MRRTVRIVAVLVAIAAAGLPGGRRPAAAEEGPQRSVADGPSPRPAAITELILADGSRFHGTVDIAKVPVRTAYGRLEVPVGQLLRIRVARGIDAETRKQLKVLIAQLGSQNYEDREKATEQLRGMSYAAIHALRQAAGDTDAEVGSRARGVLDELERELAEASEEVPGEAPLVGTEDEIVTRSFTAKGLVEIEQFNVRTDYGRLEVPRSKVVCVHFGEVKNVETTVTLTGFNTLDRPVRTAVRVRAGELLKFSSSGTIYFSDEDANCAPCGNMDFWGAELDGYPGNAVVGRIGTEGSFFLIGECRTVKAPCSGELQLCLAYSGGVGGASGEFKVRVAVKRRQ